MAGLAEDDVCAVLTEGDLELRGRLTDASNATLLTRVTAGSTSLPCVYKPVRGERPLWDFPPATLARREVAAYELSRAAGLDVVPPTVFRDGPVGEGSVQVWVGESAFDEDGDPVPAEGGAGVIDLFRPDRVPDGWRPVLAGEDGAGQPVVLAHADDPALRAMAVFDAIANNADRKAGHVLRDVGGGIFGVDHGLTFNEEHKLRTVLWGFGDEPLGDELLQALDGVEWALGGAAGVPRRSAGERHLSGLRRRLDALLSRDEIAVTRRRVRRLIEVGVFPAPREGYPMVPWPLF